MEVKDSTGKIIGKTEITENKIIIDNRTKPQLIIEDKNIIQKVLNKDESAFETLFNDYFLMIGEIASLYGIAYATARKHLIALGINTNSHAGRRNSSFGLVFSEERKKKIGEKSRGRKIKPYERTPEIREKISKGLKSYYSTHEVSDETRKKLSQAWKDGKYKNSPMGRGYNGYMFSIKNNKDIHFRSLLELYYYLQLELDDNVNSYVPEPFVIKLPENHKYIPDLLINGENLIELKPFNHLNWENEDRWEMEIKGAKEYCEQHNFSFQIVYDIDIDFESRRFKRWFLNHQDELTQYNIRLDKEIIWS